MYRPQLEHAAFAALGVASGADPLPTQLCGQRVRLATVWASGQHNDSCAGFQEGRDQSIHRHRSLRAAGDQQLGCAGQRMSQLSTGGPICCRLFDRRAHCGLAERGLHRRHNLRDDADRIDHHALAVSIRQLIGHDSGRTIRARLGRNEPTPDSAPGVPLEAALRLPVTPGAATGSTRSSIEQSRIASSVHQHLQAQSLGPLSDQTVNLARRQVDFSLGQRAGPQCPLSEAVAESRRQTDLLHHPLASSYHSEPQHRTRAVQPWSTCRGQRHTARRARRRDPEFSDPNGCLRRTRWPAYRSVRWAASIAIRSSRDPAFARPVRNTSSS